MLTKFASLEVGEILEVKGSRERITGAGLDKLAAYEDYRTDDGYLYTRVRAISSRVNKNHDGWPSDELAKSYHTFIGKPIFVDHNNSDPSRARGVIVDAKLHIEDDPSKYSALDPYYSNAPDNHKPPTWIELLLEVDAKRFPKLAAAIIADDIDGVSMGANVERSVCSHCKNVATTPEEYCEHVMNKGAHYDRYDDFGNKTSAASYEDCYDIGFFEISYVFDPADETALDLGDKKHAIAKTASVEPGTKVTKVLPNVDITIDQVIAAVEKMGMPKKLKPSVKNQMNRQQQELRQRQEQSDARKQQAEALKVRQREWAKGEADNDRLYLGEPDENYQVPEHAPEGGALGLIGAPPLEGTGKETPYWKHPDKTPSDIKAPGQMVTFDPCPTCKGGVNRAGCPTCGGSGHVQRPTPKVDPSTLSPVQPSPYRQQVIDNAATVPEDVRADRMKQKKRTQGAAMDPVGSAQIEPAAGPEFEHDCDQCKFYGKLHGSDVYNCHGQWVVRRSSEPGHYVSSQGTPLDELEDPMLGAKNRGAEGYENYVRQANMDMGGFGAAPNDGGGTPPLPGAQAEGQKCPTCGGAMENGVCPTCTQQGQEAGQGGPTGGDSPASGMMGATSKFKIASDGRVHYAADAFDPMPPHAVNAEWDDTVTPDMKATQLDADRMQPGMTAEDKAERAVGMSMTIPEAVDQLLKWGFPSEEMAYAYAEAAADKKYHNEFAQGESGMPQDPFLAKFKIDKSGAVHYALNWRDILGLPDTDPEKQAWLKANSEKWADEEKAMKEREKAQKTAEAPLPQSMMTTAPEDVNTLRQEKVCEVCGSDMEDGKCDVCGYEVPPEGFDNPDLEKAQQVAEMGAQDAAPGGGEPPPGVMAPPGGPGGSGGGPGPGAGPPPPGAGGGAPTASTRNTSQTPAVTSERTAGKIRSNEQPILPATKTVSDHPKTTQVVKEPTRLTQSNTTAMTQIPTTAQVAAEMVKRGTFGVKTAAEATALLEEKGLTNFLAANPASDPAEHHQEVDQVGGEVDNPEKDVQHINVEKAVDIEKIPTKTWSNGEGDSLGQESPVTSEKFEGGGPIGTQAATKAADTQQSGIFGDEIAAEKQIDVEKPLQPEFTKGPETQTFKSDPFHVGDPVTTEDSNAVGGPIGTPLSSVQRSQIVAHTLSSLKIAEQMVELGLISEEDKFNAAAQIQEETPEQLAVRRDMLARTKTAAARAPQRVAAAPKLSKLVNSSRNSGVEHEIADDNLGDSALFSR